jgi:hypothetical protein
MIALMKVRPHLSDSSKAHKLISKLWLNTPRENDSSPSILITPLSEINKYLLLICIISSRLGIILSSISSKGL